MYDQVEKSKEKISHSAANGIFQNKSVGKSISQFVDNRPESIVQRKLQTMTKNYPVQLQAYEITNATIQMAKSDPGNITEGDWAHVPSGGTLTFSSLSAGCLAVVVNFNGGGGAGVHLALNLDKQSQWRPFTDAIAAKKITEVFLYGDIVGTEQGWYVQSGFDEDYMPTPNTEISPASLGDLQNQGVGGAEGWAYDIGSMKVWFKKTLGAGAVSHISTQDVAHVCP